MDESAGVFRRLGSALPVNAVYTCAGRELTRAYPVSLAHA